MERPEATAGQEDEESHDASVRSSHVILISVGDREFPQHRLRVDAR